MDNLSGFSQRPALDFSENPGYTKVDKGLHPGPLDGKQIGEKDADELVIVSYGNMFVISTYSVSRTSAFTTYESL